MCTGVHLWARTCKLMCVFEPACVCVDMRTCTFVYSCMRVHTLMPLSWYSHQAWFQIRGRMCHQHQTRNLHSIKTYDSEVQWCITLVCKSKKAPAENWADTSPEASKLTSMGTPIVIVNVFRASVTDLLHVFERALFAAKSTLTRRLSSWGSGQSPRSYLAFSRAVCFLHSLVESIEKTWPQHYKDTCKQRCCSSYHTCHPAAK